RGARRRRIDSPPRGWPAAAGRGGARSAAWRPGRLCAPPGRRDPDPRVVCFCAGSTRRPCHHRVASGGEMAHTLVVTDSSAGLPPAVRRRTGLRIVPIRLELVDGEGLDGEL